MFGYIMPNREELKIREDQIYHSYYCGLCRTLGSRYKARGRMTLNYDMTFLVILLTSLYELDIKESSFTCPVHPAKKQRERISDASAYAADMNIILSYYNLLDKWNDEGDRKSKAAAALLKGDLDKASVLHPEKARKIEEGLKELSAFEKSGVKDIEKAASITGRMTAQVFAWKQDEWEENLAKIGFFLGKFIYFLDAYEDIDKDISSGSYNPFKEIRNDPGFDERCKEILVMQISECCRVFERLPIIDENLGILRNILYSGAWSKFAAAWQKRVKEDPEIKQEV
ncbi:MAG: DUF5685 family protein [Lachnospiraceae bacterium]|nr:DUF5685 family protein [Lachnospiraceae bacterium]